MLTSAKDFEGNVLSLDFLKLHMVLSIYAKFFCHARIRNKVGGKGKVYPPPPARAKTRSKYQGENRVKEWLVFLMNYPG